MRHGYACLTVEKGFQNPNRTCQKKKYTDLGLRYIDDLVLINIKNLQTQLQWNINHGINFFRISSSLFPWISEYNIGNLWCFPKIKKILSECGELSRKSGIRLTFHPSHFIKLASLSDEYAATSIHELEMYNLVFDFMGFEPSHFNKINIHVGCGIKDSEKIIKLFSERFLSLSESCQARITLENDDKPNGWTVQDLYINFYSTLKIPIVFDYFHHSLSPGTLTESEALELSLSTWHDSIPVVHYSSSRKLNEDSSAVKTAHADYIYEQVPDYGFDFDIMFEAKAKNLALSKYLNEHRKIENSVYID